MDADAKLMHEGPPIGRRDIDRADRPAGNGFQRRIEVQGHAQRPGKQVHCTGRQHRQGYAGLEGDPRRGRDGAIPAPRQDRIGAAVSGGGPQGRLDVAPRHHLADQFMPMRGKNGRGIGRKCLQIHGPQSSAIAIEHGNDTQTRNSGWTRITQ
ncbi:hypothetical protein D9M68_846600 [compost metagenome]